MKTSLAIALFISLALPAVAQAAPEGALTLDEAVSAALATSPIVKESEAAAQRAEIESRLGLSPFLPKLALEAGSVTKAPAEHNKSGRFFYGDATWNLFNGGLDRQARRIQNAEEHRARTRQILTRAQVSRDVVREVADLLFIDESIRLKNEALALNKEQMQLAKRKAQGGLTSSADVLEFEFRENTLNTELTLLRHERAVRSRNLSTLIGSEPNPNLQIKGELSTDMAATVAAPDATPEFMRSERLLDPQADALVSDLQMESTYGTWLPRADLNARYGNLEFADPEVERVPGWRLEFKITLPLFSGLETFSARQLAAAKQHEAQARLRRADLELKNDLADRDEKLGVLENLLRLQSENMSRAERYYQATLSEYRRGLRNSPDLSGATERLLEVRLKTKALIKDVVMTKLGLLSETKSELP